LLDRGRLLRTYWVDANVVLEFEALEISRAVAYHLSLLIQHFLGLRRIHVVAGREASRFLLLFVVYIGSPNSQPAKVVFDTGSEFLAVTSTLCSDETTPE
jgi:hypothetical protein